MASHCTEGGDRGCHSDGAPAQRVLSRFALEDEGIDFFAHFGFHGISRVGKNGTTAKTQPLNDQAIAPGLGATSRSRGPVAGSSGLSGSVQAMRGARQWSEQQPMPLSAVTPADAAAYRPRDWRATGAYTLPCSWRSDAPIGRTTVIDLPPASSGCSAWGLLALGRQSGWEDNLTGLKASLKSSPVAPSFPTSDPSIQPSCCLAAVEVESKPSWRNSTSPTKDNVPGISM